MNYSTNWASIRCWVSRIIHKYNYFFVIWTENRVIFSEHWSAYLASQLQMFKLLCTVVIIMIIFATLCCLWDSIYTNDILSMQLHLRVTNQPTRDIDSMLDQWCPGKHEMLTQCCFDVGPASKTMGQHQNYIGLISRVCWGVIDPTLGWCLVFAGEPFSLDTPSQQNTRRWANANLMLARVCDAVQH